MHMHTADSNTRMEDTARNAPPASTVHRLDLLDVQDQKKQNNGKGLTKREVAEIEGLLHSALLKKQTPDEFWKELSGDNAEDPVIPTPIPQTRALHIMTRGGGISCLSATSAPFGWIRFACRRVCERLRSEGDYNS